MLYSVINTNSSHRDAYHQLAILHSQLNKTTEALDSIVKALTLCSPDDISCAHLYVEHGDILRDLRDWQSAAESYRIAISLDSGISRSHLNLAVICHLEGEYKIALHHYLVAHSLDPNNAIIAENISKLKRQLYRHKDEFAKCFPEKSEKSIDKYNLQTHTQPVVVDDWEDSLYILDDKHNNV
ncbi:unnamed protein product [Medioppia subpectinata]|uniref:Tetratricopeptide repeat protein n=1 Tax=Medioppia subpectinata TaxID=1979941 RepID=A0A7R9L5S6_9ACAR|nr:unnamed protein product [Medioppia subpectinata]CAG2116039.1 unnamed protein product [Medioppia subpectinata]